MNNNCENSIHANGWLPCLFSCNPLYSSFDQNKWKLQRCISGRHPHFGPLFFCWGAGKKTSNQSSHYFRNKFQREREINRHQYTQGKLLTSGSHHWQLMFYRFFVIEKKYSNHPRISNIFISIHGLCEAYSKSGHLLVSEWSLGGQKEMLEINGVCIAS